jgi:nitrite reductase (NADH) large subunit
MNKEKLVLIGNGMAGVRMLEELLKLAPDKYDITVFGKESYGNYNRILLSAVLADEMSFDEIMLNDDRWYTDHNITLHKGNKVVHIDRKARKVTAEGGTEWDYDRIILATGSDPIVIPVPGSKLPGVVTFRDIHDVNAMLEASTHHRKAVVVGGGLLGLEGAHGLMKRGMEVTVVHLRDALMERQLDKSAAELLKHSLEQRGLKILTEQETSAILGEDWVRGIRFKNGSEVEADLVVMAAGIRPNITLAQAAGLRCGRGIAVNDVFQTSDHQIYAVGECAEHRGTTYGLVAPLFEQAKICAQHLAGRETTGYHGSVIATSLKVTGIDVFSAGDFASSAGCETIVLRDPGLDVYRKLVLKDDRLCGAVLFGETASSSWYTDLIREQADVSAIRDIVMFGPDFFASPCGPEYAKAA